MTAQELRIGNYVNNMGVMIKFDEADWECIVSKAFSQNPMERYTPIPLTEEWLLKFGFKYNKLQFCSNTIICHQYKIKGICLSIDERKVNKHEYSFFGNNFIRTVKHVHQLQNLYFALTGEELKLK